MRKMKEERDTHRKSCGLCVGGDGRNAILDSVARNGVTEKKTLE